MHHSKIIDIAYHVPAATLDNAQCQELFPDLKASQIERKIGVVSRHIAANGETAADLAVQAAEKILAEHNRNAIDYVIFCTQSPDFKLPASACIIHHRLGLKTSAGAIDINQGCSGYVYGLSLAKGLIASGSCRHILLLTGDTYTKYIHADDRGNRTIFGDGASATLISVSENPDIGEFVFGTDGAGSHELIVENGACRHPAAPLEDKKSWLHMNGPEIFNFTIEMVPPLYKAVLAANAVDVESVDAVLFHQANTFMLKHLMELCAIPEEKFIIDMKDVGNTVSSTIPIALCRRVFSGYTGKKCKVLLLGFGVGYSWAGVVVDMDL